MDASIIVPVFNEEKNIDIAAKAISDNMVGYEYELIFVNDGSNDSSKKQIERNILSDNRIKLITYDENIGRGYAIRQGIKKAAGNIVVTIDADLSYDPKYIPKMMDCLADNEDVDMVFGSPYLDGGNTEGVNKLRLQMSKIANRFLSTILPVKLKTYTSILRAYKKDAIKSLELMSDDKDIHVEIISKAYSFGYKIAELPVELRSRKFGKSKTRYLSALSTHIIFSFFEKPSFYFSMLGMLLIFIGLISGGYIIYLWQLKLLNPNRPLINLTVILLLSGMQLIIFGLITAFISTVKREIFSLQKKLYFLSKSDDE